MREVQLVWDTTSDPLGIFQGLSDVFSSMKVLCHLEITETGIRQILEPTFQSGKGVEDVAALPYFDVESTFENNTLVVWNTHPLVRMATAAENIQILPPYELAEGEVRITVRGLPETVGNFVRLCRQSMPPKHIKVQRVVESGDELEDRLTKQQFACFIADGDLSGSFQLLSFNFSQPRLQDHHPIRQGFGHFTETEQLAAELLLKSGARG